MTTNQPRSFGRRLWWIIRTTVFIFIIVALVAAAVGGLGYAGYQIQRSNDSLTMRIEASEKNLDSLRDLVNTEFAEGDPEQQVQINQLQNELDNLAARLESLQTAAQKDGDLQAEQIDTLEAELATAVAQNGDLAEELETVQAALVALQGDFNNSGVRLDELGGDVDRFRLRLDTLDTALTEFTTATTAARDSETAELQQTLVLLQLWGVLTNARLALLDGDATVAETAVAQALTLANNLTAEPESPAAAALDRLQTRLGLAADGFTASLPTVAQDLEAASRELNLLIVGPTPEAELVEATGTPEATATPSETSEATTTPTPDVTPSSTVLPTATP